MMGMDPHLDWPDILIRLALTVLAGILIGYDRSESGKAAGMRTTLLVCLAASVAMIQVNLLLPTAGRAKDSFVMNDLMRFPLGILTGVGFIGGGAILRRDNIVVGVTTAATLWLVTVIGLCLGGGQLGLGLAATALGIAALWGLKWVEAHMHQDLPTHLSLELAASGPSEEAVRAKIASRQVRIAGYQFLQDLGSGHRTLELDLIELRRVGDTRTPGFVHALGAEEGVNRIAWQARRQS
jgi:putative Mg2+ transporter-C (MgtC) family protein